MSRKGRLKVAIDARARQGLGGGVAQAVMSLVYSLGKLDDGSEEYKVIVGSPEQLEWLKPFAGPNLSLLMKGNAPQVRKDSAARRLLRPVARYLRKRVASEVRRWPEVSVSDGYYESLGCDVMHFMTQSFTLCALPTIYNPHDLQHLHYPQFFNPWTIATRETVYPAGCRLSNTVVVGSKWIKDDVVRHYGVNPDKVQIIPEGPPTHFFAEPSREELSRVMTTYGLEQPFILYPAVTWPHKNHIRLIEALDHLRKTEGKSVRLVCTGSKDRSFWPRIEEAVGELKSFSQVKFLGFVPEEDLRAIYRLSQFLIMPTLFEASSLPIFEAWLEGVPVASADVTALPDQVADAALLFDPNGVESISNAIATLSSNSELRGQLRERGYQRLRDFDCERTAKAYRAVYRRAAGYPLTEEDRWLLSWDWMRHPRGSTDVGYDERQFIHVAGPTATGDLKGPVIESIECSVEAVAPAPEGDNRRKH
jgi:glycosyltransferase involved in cell wall biosynthesis